MYTIYDFEIEYDTTQGKYYLLKNCGDLIKSFYDTWSLKEFLMDEYGLIGPQVESAIYNA